MIKYLSLDIFLSSLIIVVLVFVFSCVLIGFLTDTKVVFFSVWITFFSIFWIFFSGFSILFIFCFSVSNIGFFDDSVYCLFSNIFSEDFLFSNLVVFLIDSEELLALLLLAVLLSDSFLILVLEVCFRISLSSVLPIGFLSSVFALLFFSLEKLNDLVRSFLTIFFLSIVLLSIDFCSVLSIFKFNFEDLSPISFL